MTATRIDAGAIVPDQLSREVPGTRPDSPTSTAAANDAGIPAEVYRDRWLIRAVMLTAEIMDLLDSTVVNVAGPDLERSLGS